MTTEFIIEALGKPALRLFGLMTAAAYWCYWRGGWMQDRICPSHVGVPGLTGGDANVTWCRLLHGHVLYQPSHAPSTNTKR